MAEQKKEEKKMETLYEIKTVDQKQKLLNLDTGTDEEITVTTKFISWKNGVKPEEKIKVLEHLVTPLEKRITMLENGFKSASYQESKEKALSAGVYATQGIRSNLTAYLSQFSAYNDMSAKDVWNAWLDKYQGVETVKDSSGTLVKKPLPKDEAELGRAKAKKVLDLVRQTQTVDDPLAL